MNLDGAELGRMAIILKEMRGLLACDLRGNPVDEEQVSLRVVVLRSHVVLRTQFYVLIRA